MSGPARLAAIGAPESGIRPLEEGRAAAVSSEKKKNI